MSRSIAGAFALLLALTVARAAPTPEQGASAVLDMIARGDGEGLAAAAAVLRPDPWLVADDLCARGEYDAAATFVDSTDAPTVAGVAAFVAKQREHPTTDEARQAYAAARAHGRAGRSEEALLEIAAAPAGRDDVITIRLTHERGNRLAVLGDSEGAFRAYLDAGQRAGRMGWTLREANTLFLAGRIARAAGDEDAALETWERARTGFRRVGHGRNEALAANGVGTLRYRRGEFPAAREAHERALAIHRSASDRRGEAESLTLLGNALARLGEYAASLNAHESAIELSARSADRARALQNATVVLANLGDLDRALDHQERARKLYVEGGLQRQLVVAQLVLGHIHRLRGDLDASDEVLSRGLETASALQDARRMALFEGSLGENSWQRGGFTEARAHYVSSLERAGAAGDPALRALARSSLGALDLREGKLGQAWEHLARARDEALAAGDGKIVGDCLTGLAGVRLAQGRPREALRLAKEAMERAGTQVRGLSLEEGAVARRALGRPHEIGVRAALTVGDEVELFHFLEYGRSGALLEALGGREAVRSVDVPADLLLRREAAEAALATAAEAHARASATGRRREIGVRRRELNRAREVVRTLDARVERRRRQTAAIGAVVPAEPASVREALGPHRALVLYHSSGPEAIALVIGALEMRTVRLGDSSALIAACAAADLGSADADGAMLLADLERRLVTPLELEETVRTVLVSPEGALSTVPFGPLFKERDSAVIPSATAWLHLRAAAGLRGEGVLAIGDPEYGRGGRFSPLFHSGPEVKAVGTSLLLGPDATEATFRSALGESPRWRTVHFACHGVFDPRHPTLSALALTRTPDDDGLLTALEIGRLDIPADLVVLSACETARGRVYEGEGLLGLTSAFPLAGSPRVLASLWKVDDAATRRLMEEFYRAYRDGTLSASAALRRAQATVKAMEAWSHPRFWSGWVLWGLAD